MIIEIEPIKRTFVAIDVNDEYVNGRPICYSLIFMCDTF